MRLRFKSALGFIFLLIAICAFLGVGYIFYGKISNDSDIVVDGKITIKDLPLGKYKFIEKEAPDGYILNTDEHFFEIKEDGEIVKSYLTNEKEIFEVPKTSVSDSKVIDVVTIILVIAGIGFIVYDKRKNK